MGDYSFTVECVYCALTLIQVQNASASYWKNDANINGGHHVECPTCGCRFKTADDGVDIGSGGGVCTKNISRPSLASLNVSSGSREGGNALIITGEALDVGTLVVKFAEEACPVVDNRTSTTARVVLPAATYTLNVLERCHKLTLDVITGSLSVGEAVTTLAGSTGTIRLIDGTTYWIAFANFAETLEAMVGTSLVGSSGGTADIDSVEAVPFTVGETVFGLSSVVSGTVREDMPLLVYAPTGGFAPNELIQGADSGALAKLTGSPAYASLVDVSVENEYGQRLTGGTLSGAYTYA